MQFCSQFGAQWMIHDHEFHGFVLRLQLTSQRILPTTLAELRQQGNLIVLIGIFRFSDSQAIPSGREARVRNALMLAMTADGSKERRGPRPGRFDMTV
jgi:hypothetical protein